MAALNENLTARDILGDHPTLAQFLDDDFDYGRFSYAVIEGNAVASSLEMLKEGVEKINTELERQVAAHDEDLLRQAQGVQTLEIVLETVTGRVQSLQEGVKRLVNKISEPYEQVRARTDQLTRLQSACDLLRRVREVLNLCRRLQSQFGTTRGNQANRELSKAAQTVNELEYLLADHELQGVVVVDRQRVWVRKMHTELETEANRLLQRGMESQNQAEVALALQVYHNLNQLSSVVSDQLNSLLHNAQSSVQKFLRVDTLGAEVTGGNYANVAVPPPNAGPAWHAALWNRMEKLTDELCSGFVRAYYLERVLAKKRDPNTPQLSFLELLPHDILDRLQAFWPEVMDALKTELARTAESSTFVRQTFDSEYPKLLRTFMSLWTRVWQHVGNKQSQAIHESAAEELRKTIEPFERSYLGKSLRRMFDPINVAFPEHGKSVATNADVEAICKPMITDLRVVVSDPTLCLLVARNVQKAINLFAQKCEHLSSTDRDAVQVSGPCTASQTRNIAAVNALDKLVTVLEAAELSPAVRQIINVGLTEALAQRNAIAEPLLTAIRSRLEDRFTRMHSGELSGEDNTAVDDAATQRRASPYLVDLQTTVAHLHSELLVRFRAESLIRAWALEVCNKLLWVFCANAVLVRPLGASGRLQLVSDMTGLEVALGSLLALAGLRNLAELDYIQYSTFKLMKSLLFTDNEGMVSFLNSVQPVECREKMRVLAVLHLFSRSPSNIMAPHERANWTISHWIDWLQDHSSTEALSVVQHAVAAYVRDADAAGAKEYVETYPYIVKLLESA